MSVKKTRIVYMIRKADFIDHSELADLLFQAEITLNTRSRMRFHFDIAGLITAMKNVSQLELIPDHFLLDVDVKSSFPLSAYGVKLELLIARDLMQPENGGYEIEFENPENAMSDCVINIVD